ncbi:MULTISPECIES: DMT family transporter [Methylovorus]|uniref:EamA domain-containing protein n=1 Tax=Methylovorus glucosotrophus (strain SIP3-4) TaxID=582744 RepID=C6X8K6_METGS|nr:MULTISPECIES: DMT family transporter [Methylovorus]ACT49476.1 protein of unknown function DUF6 transmembrane [Methylovorus glucosotrophus SIP3-4]ADQ83428.1 conserved hypothetical protein [Methylovorus sp. MP688]
MSTFISSRFSSPMAGIAMVLLASVAVSSKAIIVKLAYVYPVDPATLIALRMAFSIPFFAALAWWSARQDSLATLSLRQWMAVLGLGAIGGYGPMWLDFAGLAYVSAGLERIILFLYPTMVLMFSALLFRQAIGRRELFALITGYAGVGLVVGHDIEFVHGTADATLMGAALVFASAVLYAAYLVLSGKLIPQVGASRFTAYTMLVATFTSGMHYAGSQHVVSWSQLPGEVYLLSLLMAVVATVLPAVLLNIGIQRLGSNRASLISSIGPVSTIFLAWVFLGEHITWLQLGGTALVMAGVLAVSLGRTPA